jgi:hypothetical protein
VKEVVKNFLLKSVERNGVIRIGTYSIGFSIINYFLEQWRLVEIGLVNTVENSVKTNEEIGSREEPDMVFDEYGWWVKLVGKKINDGFENGSRGKKHYIDKSLFVFKWKRKEEMVA